MKKLILLFVLLLGFSVNSMAQNENCTMLFEYYNAQDDRAGKLLDVLQQEKKDEMSILNEKVKEIKKNRKNNLLMGVVAGVAAVGTVAAIAASSNSNDDSSNSSSTYTNTSSSATTSTANTTSTTRTTSQNTATSNQTQPQSNQEVVVSGETLNRHGVLMKISGEKVTSICAGTDSEGRQNWQTIPATKYSKNTRRIGTSDSSLNAYFQMKEYEVTIDGTRIWFDM